MKLRSGRVLCYPEKSEEKKTKIANVHMGVLSRVGNNSELEELGLHVERNDDCKSYETECKIL